MNNPYFYLFKQIKKGSLELYSKREELVKQYSWAIPDQTSIDLISKYSPLVEMGAGGGYWASLIKQNGGEILCFDKATKNNQYSEKQWTEINKGLPKDLINYSARTLFLCWPPYEDEMAAQCLRFFEGRYVIYIGESEGGCTANDHFFNMLRNHFNLIEEHQNPAWQYIHDRIYIYERKS